MGGWDMGHVHRLLEPIAVPICKLPTNSRGAIKITRQGKKSSPVVIYLLFGLFYGLYPLMFLKYSSRIFQETNKSRIEP
jgi:hypothetical protein